MDNHPLPCELMQHLKHFDQYESLPTLGVYEEKQMHKFPMYLHRHINPHLSLHLV
jgi:hypothetical protein